MPPFFWHVDVQFDLDSRRTCVQLQSDTKRLVLIAIHGTAAAGLGGAGFDAFTEQRCSIANIAQVAT